MWFPRPPPSWNFCQVSTQLQAAGEEARISSNFDHPAPDRRFPPLSWQMTCIEKPSSTENSHQQRGGGAWGQARRAGAGSASLARCSLFVLIRCHANPRQRRFAPADSPRASHARGRIRPCILRPSSAGLGRSACASLAGCCRVGRTMAGPAVLAGAERSAVLCRMGAYRGILEWHDTLRAAGRMASPRRHPLPRSHRAHPPAAPSCGRS